MSCFKIRNLVGVLFVILIGASQATGAVAGRKIVIAHGVMTANALPLWIAREQQFFDKYGLMAETVVVRGTPLVIAGLVSGDVQLGYTGGTGVIGGVAGGVDLKTVATFFNTEALRIITRPDIKRSEDLRGKRLGVQSVGGANWMMSMLALEQIGLTPERDKIQVINVGGTPSRAQALEAGSIDFTVLTDASFVNRLTRRGFRLHGDFPPVPFTSLGVVVGKSYRERHGDVIESALKALVEAVAFAVLPRNKDVTIGVLAKWLKISAASAEASYEEFVKEVERKPYTVMDGLKNIQRLMAVHNPEAGKIELRDLVDNSFIEKLDRSGFLDRLQSIYGVR